MEEKTYSEIDIEFDDGTQETIAVPNLTFSEIANMLCETTGEPKLTKEELKLCKEKAQDIPPPYVKNGKVYDTGRS